MHKYRRPLLAIAAVTALTTLMSACIVVPRGYYRHRHYQGAVAPDVAPQPAPAERAAG